MRCPWAPPRCMRWCVHAQPRDSTRSRTVGTGHPSRIRTSATKLPLVAGPAIKRVDVQFRDAVEVGHQLAQPHQKLLDALDVGRAACRGRLREPERLHLSDHSPRGGRVDRRQAEGHVAEQLHVDPAQAEHQGGAEGRVALRPEDQLVARRESCGGPTCRGFPPPAGRAGPGAARICRNAPRTAAASARFNAMPCTSDL